MFAKLYGNDDNQVLVKLDTSDEGNPEVRFFFEPKGLGVCSVAMSWNDDSDESWDKAEKAFANVTEERARSMAEKVLKDLLV